MRFKLIIDANREEEVQATVQRESEFTSRLENIVLSYNGTNKLAAYTEDEMILIPFQNIECIFLMGGKTYAVNEKGARYLLKYRLYELEELLPQNFFRINKSALANLDRLQQLALSFNGSVDAVFRCGYRDYVSRRCLSALKRRLGVS